MEEKHARCAGLDVHRKQIVVCVRLAEGKQVKRELRRFETTTSALCQLADWLEEKGCTHAVMESTGVYWKPVWHLLEGHVELVLANAQHVRNMPGRKSDMNDATWLAELMAHGLVRGSFVPPEPIRELRDQTRIRDQDVRALPEVTRYELEIEGDPRAWSAAAGMVTGILPIHPSAHEMWASKPDPGVPASDALVRARAFAAALVEAFTARASGDQHAVIAARRTMRQLAPTLFAAYLERQEHGDS